MGLFDFFRKNKVQDNSTSQSAEKTRAISSRITVNMGIQGQSVDVIPVERRIKYAFPSKNNGLYPHEILVLDYADLFYTLDNDYQGFWWYRYGVKNVDSVLNSLLRKGFITVAPVAKTVEKRTVAALKEVLDSYGLNSKGKKAVLVQRVMEEIPTDELEKLFPKRLYMRTEKGETELKAEEYISYIHRHSIEDLDIWSLNRLVYESPSRLSYRDIIWQYLNQRSQEHFFANDFGLYRNCRYSMALFLGEEGRIRSELEMLAEVVYFDLTGAGNSFNPEFLYVIAQNFFPYENSLATTASGVVKRIFDCQMKLNLTNEELRELLANRMKKLSAPIQLFEVDECVNIVFYEHTEDKKALDAVYKLAEKRFQKKYPNLKKASH